MSLHALPLFFEKVDICGNNCRICWWSFCEYIYSSDGVIMFDDCNFSCDKALSVDFA